MSNGEYICECGRKFDSAQKLNGHHSHCLIHFNVLNKNTSVEYLNQIRVKGFIKANNIRHEKAVYNKEAETLKWISELHRCEKCGKIMIEKFGSGRFCSRACANSHAHSLESKVKVATTILIKNGKSVDEAKRIAILETNRKHKQRKHYNGPKLPEVVVENLQPNYPSRSRMSYAEKFWKTVLDNNNINYKYDYKVLKNNHTTGCYKLDFLIGDNIDLEIDGEFHKLPLVIEKDKRRTLYLESIGYIVYRILWVNPNSNNNKIIVNNQIDELFNFLNILRIV